MRPTRAPLRVLSLLSLAVLLGSGLPLFSPAAEAGTRFFEESWELGSTGWTYSTDHPTARQDCTGLVAYRGLCSLEVEAQTRGVTSSASRDLGLRFDAPGYVVSFYFRNDWPYLKSAGEFKMRMGDGTDVTANLSYGTGNMVSVSTQTARTGAFMTPSGQLWMYEEEVWYRLLLHVDLVEGKLRAEVRSADDALLASAPGLAFSSGSVLERVSFEGSYFGSGSLTQAPQKINYDLLSIADPDAPGAPRHLKALSGPGLGEVTVDWQAPADDGGAPILAYNVYRGDSAEDVTTLLGTTTSRRFVDAGAEGGEVRYYAVRAVNAAGEGARSDAFAAATVALAT